MDRHVLGFLRSSLLWLGAGVTLGVCMAFSPALTVYRTAHLHMMLLGFVTMMISGVAYQVFPRFAATPLYSVPLAKAHLVMANLGLVLLAGGFAMRAYGSEHAPLLLGMGGLISAAGAFALVINLWRTLDHAAVAPNRLPPLRPLQMLHPDKARR